MAVRATDNSEYDLISVGHIKVHTIRRPSVSKRQSRNKASSWIQSEMLSRPFQHTHTHSTEKLPFILGWQRRKKPSDTLQ